MSKIRVDASTIRLRKEIAIDKIKMLRGEPPYNTWSNICYADGYFAQSIMREFKCNSIEEIWEWATSE